MPNFEIIRFELNCKRQSFYKLIKDGYCAYDDFIKSLDSRYESDIDRISTIMEEVGNGVRLPKTMFRPLPKRHKDSFEIKAGELRVYGMHVEKTGNIVIFCGNKDSQDEDLDALPKRIREFINHLNEQKNGNKGKKRPNKK